MFPYTESKLKKSVRLPMLNSFTAVKTKFIERKSPWTMCTCIELWFLGEKKLGSVRTLFFLPCIESKAEFTNISLKSPKIEKLNIDTLFIPQGLSSHEKTRVKKSHATVPLMCLFVASSSFPLTWNTTIKKTCRDLFFGEKLLLGAFFSISRLQIWN